MKKPLILLLTAYMSAHSMAGAGGVAQQGCVFEASYQTTRHYANPFTDVEVNVVFTQGEKQWVVPAFWAGGGTWTVRFAPPGTGEYRYRVSSTDKSNTDLNRIEQTLQVTAYTGKNPLIKHGPLSISKDKRHFEHADGTPFFWLGDTWWKGLCKRIPFDGFQKLTADRKAKGFTVVQIIAGPYPDEPPFDPRWANEGGMPYEPGYEKINPSYFDFADRRIRHLVDAGIVPAIVGGWGWHMPAVGVEKMNRHWRYLVARYAAYPVVWIVGGEAGGPEWTAVAGYLRSIDPFHRLATMHPYPGSGRQAVDDETLLDFDMVQTGHGGVFGTNSPYGIWQATAANTVSKVMSSYSKTPPVPVVVGEVTYEGHMMANGGEVQRQVFWSSMLSGSAGHTYGAGGIWQMNSGTERGAEYEFTPWDEAMHLPGSTQLSLGKKLLEKYPWWRFEPHPEWVDPHCTTLFEPHAQWYDDSKLFDSLGGRWDLPYAAGIPEEVRIIFIPGHYYDWSAPTILKLEHGVPYHAFLFNPGSGERYEMGIVINAPASADSSAQKPRAVKEQPLVMRENPRIVPEVKFPDVTYLSGGEYKLPRLPAPQDWVLVMERAGSR